MVVSGEMHSSFIRSALEWYVRHRRFEGLVLPVVTVRPVTVSATKIRSGRRSHGSSPRVNASAMRIRTGRRAAVEKKLL